MTDDWLHKFDDAVKALLKVLETAPTDFPAQSAVAKLHSVSIHIKNYWAEQELKNKLEKPNE